MITYRPIAQVEVLDPYKAPRKLLDPLIFQTGSAKRLIVSANYTGPQPRTNRLQDIAEWIDANGLHILSDVQETSNHYRLVIGQPFANRTPAARHAATAEMAF